MRILVVSDYLHQGGAAIACNRLCDGLVDQPDVEVHRYFFVPCATPGRLRFTSTPASGRRIEAFLQLLESPKSTPLVASLRRRFARTRLRKTIAEFRPDVVNLHNLHGFAFSIDELAAACQGLPLIWTLHDMWSFTGRCAYAYSCERFISGCDATCPTPTEYPPLPPKEIAPAWQAKQRFLQGRARTAAICPSAWLAAEARRGIWSVNTVETVPNGLPLEVFFPVEKRAARAALGLPLEGRYAAIAADYLTERRKGGDIIAHALGLANRPGTALLAMGHARNLAVEGMPIHALGYVSDDAVKRLVYSAADLLIHPAPVDNLPNTVVEALACGTPTAAFAVGGLPEMVIPGVTGWLCAERGAELFAACLSQAFDDLAKGLSFSTACRERAVARHSPAVMAQAYVSVAKRLLAEATASP